MPARSSALRRLARSCVIACGLVACAGDSDESADGVVELTDVRLFEANDSLNDVRGIAIGPRSDAWVIGSPAPFIHHFDSGGTLIGSFGRGGQGPGEIAVPHEVFAPQANDSLVRVWSPGRAVITTFDRSGRFVQATARVALTEVAIPGWVDKIDYVRFRPISRWGGGYLVQDVPPREQGLTSATQIANARLLVLDSVGAIVDTLIDFSKLTGPSRAAPTVMYLAPVPVWTTCANGTAAVVDPFGMRLLRYAADGRVGRTDTLPVDAPRITDEDVRRMLRNFATTREAVPGGRTPPDSAVDWMVEEYLTRRREEVGRTGPPAVRVLCDEESNTWLQRYDTTNDPRGLGREWAVVGNGRILRRYRFPAGFQPLTLNAGTAFGVQKDSLDVERVGAVRYGRR